jgi:hypothetical protein
MSPGDPESRTLGGHYDRKHSMAMPHGSHGGDMSVGSLALMGAARIPIRPETTRQPLIKNRPSITALDSVVIFAPIVRRTKISGTHAGAMFPTEQVLDSEGARAGDDRRGVRSLRKQALAMARRLAGRAKLTS